MQRILIVKMWALGDILMATPLLRKVRRMYPGCAIDWLVEECHAPILAGNPLIDSVIAFDSGKWRAMLRKGDVFGYVRTIYRLRRGLSRARYDAVLNLTGDKLWTALFLLAPKRYGQFTLRPSAWIRGLYDGIVVKSEHTDRHNTLLYLDVLPDPSDSGDVDDLSLILSRPDNPARILTDSGMNLVAEAAGADGPLIVIAPYSTSDNRNWEDDRCVALCRWLRATYGALVAVTCSGRDRERGQALCRAVGEIGVECVSKASLTEYIALIAMSQLVVCADSSAMHIAAALGTPFVALFGATPVERRKPLRGRGVAVCKPIPCAPCDKQTCAHSEFRACMRAIELADVQAAVESPAVHDMNPSPGQPAPRQA